MKLHTHGVWEPNQDAVLGPSMTGLHETLERMAGADGSFRYFYVTARQLANAVFAAGELGRPASPADFDHRLVPVERLSGVSA